MCEGWGGLLHTRYEAHRATCGPLLGGTLICLFLFIPFVPLRPALQVLEGKIFTLNSRKVFLPDCVRTCRDVPPGFLPSSFLPLTPSFPSASTSSKADGGAPVSASLLQQLSLCKARGKVTREDRKRAAFTGLKVVACCCWLVTVIVLKPQQEWSEWSSLFCLKPTIWTLGAMFNTF